MKTVHDFARYKAEKRRISIVTAYDAIYVALAEVLGGRLLTRDGRLARSRGHSAEIELK